MNNIVDHPRRMMGTTKTLSRNIAVKRTKVIADLHEAIACLVRVANDPRSDFAREFVHECEHILGEIEELDPFGSPDGAKVLALKRRLESVRVAIIDRINSIGLAAGAKFPREPVNTRFARN